MSADVLSIECPAAQSLPGEWPEDGVAGLLSAREREVLRWVGRGKPNAEIATALYISESTVRKHLQSAYKKLGVSSRTAAVALLSGTDAVGTAAQDSRKSERLDGIAHGPLKAQVLRR